VTLFLARETLRGSVKISQVIEALERFAPLPLQESWDNAGLQVGLTSAEASGALLCLDVTEAVVDEAIARGCNLIVSHHPLIFHKLASLTGRTMEERAVVRAIREGIVIESLHTNMDNARGGVNFHIAEKLSLRDVDFISPRLVGGIECGSTVCGTLPAPLSSGEFVELVKQRFGAKCAMTNGLQPIRISRVAICGGAGGSYLGEAIAAGADAFLTGEMHYHDFFDHDGQLQIVVIGHYETEHFTSEIFRDIIERECPGLPAYISQRGKNPVEWL